LQKIAVVLFNLGGPDSLEAVKPFLFNLFCDHDIFNLPFGQKFFAHFISNRRTPKVVDEYRLIGGKSPINEWTEKQRAMLEENLRKDFPFVDVYRAMRYWKPFTIETASIIESKNYDKIVLLPLYPHYSKTTTGSSFNEWNRQYKNDSSKLIYVYSYPTNEKYIAAINQRIDESILQFPKEIRNEIQIVFSAHGTPVSLVKKGDPYSAHIMQTIDTVMKSRQFSHSYHFCFQSKVGPMKWLEPATNKKIEELAALNKKHLLIVPISFVSDHVETLFELDIQYRHIAEKVGIENYIIMKGLNDSKLFIDALSDLVKNNL
jgi:ferrochelatase